jgi:hypothetical protein
MCVCSSFFECCVKSQFPGIGIVVVNFLVLFAKVICVYFLYGADTFLFVCNV